MTFENIAPHLITNALSYIQKAPDENLFANRADMFELFENNSRKSRLSAGAVITDPHNRVLMVENYKAGKILPPGGKADISDDNLIQTAIRECREETGLKLHEMEAEPPLYISIFEVKGVKMLDFGFWFRVDQAFESMELKRRKSEVKEIYFTPLSELRKSNDVCIAHAANIILKNTAS